MSGDPSGKLVCVCVWGCVGVGGVCVGVWVCVCVCVCGGGGRGVLVYKPTVYNAESGCVLADCNCLVSTRLVLPWPLTWFGNSNSHNLNFVYTISTIL